MNTSNDYLNQVMEEQAKVEQQLNQRVRRAAPAPAMASPVAEIKKGVKGLPDREDSVDYLCASDVPVGRGIDYRITGWWRFKTVVVPPNVYVVHTRRGHAEPLHLGLGISFPFNPYTDSFLIIPGVVQTLLIGARCICSERQGILVQAYVQWVVDDVKVAYRKLDFSDPVDPMRIVNIQLREQAEAAIKDKVSTMSVDEVLADKQPIIEELTHRLRLVAEGNREAGREGLGLKIVTVQLKEAVVSSTRLWENLQKPFRAEREKVARLAELDKERQLAHQQLLHAQNQQTEELASERELARLRAERDREEFDRTTTEQARRLQKGQEEERQAVAVKAGTEKARREADLDLALHELELANRRLQADLEALRREMELERVRAERDRLRATAEAELENINHQAKAGREERDLGHYFKDAEAENVLSPENVQAQLIARLPEIAQSLPKPEELRTVAIGPDAGVGSSLTGFLAGLLHLVQAKNGKPETIAQKP